MQYSRKNPGSYFMSRNITIPQNPKETKKKTISVQTDFIPNFKENVGNVSLMSIEDLRETYTRALYFLNNCHDVMNKMLAQNFRECGDSDPKENSLFRIPNIPNYFIVVLAFLEKGENINNNKTLPLKDINVNHEEFEDDLKANEEKNIFNENVGDGLSHGQDYHHFHDKVHYTDSKSIIDDFNTKKTYKRENNVATEILNVESTNKPSISGSRQCKSEKDVSKKLSQHEFEDLMPIDIIMKTCNEIEHSFGNKSLSNNLKHVLFSNTVREKSAPEIMENKHIQNINKSHNEYESKREKYGQKRKTDKKRAISPEPMDIKINDVPPENLDLMEYSLKKMHIKANQTGQKKSENKYATDIKNSEQFFPEIINNHKKDLQKSNRSLLNKPSSKAIKVNEMFKKVSQESLKCKKENIHANEHEKDLSDSDSVILDDEEFQIKKHHKSWEPAVELERFANGSGCATHFANSYNVQEKSTNKFHPLQLSDKDMPFVDDKMLKNIGLFTESGDIRPSVINMLQEKQRTSSVNSFKNKQFRTKRTLDFQIHFNPNVDLEKSISSGSASENSVSGHMTTSMQSSVIAFSSSDIISESDLLNVEGKHLAK